MRADGRAANELRPVKMTPDFIPSAEGSVLIEAGRTRVIVTATVNDGVPSFLKGTGKGWVTGEYGMLPRATEERTPRESTRGRQSGRTLEIQRMIGRTLRAATDLKALGERTVWVDCDVIEADGGTRTASVTGAFVALALALERMVAAGMLRSVPLLDSVAATSVGIVDDQPLLDLAYEEDSRAQVDMNVVMTGDGRFVEVQASAEGRPYTNEELQTLLDLASGGIRQLVQAAAGPGARELPRPFAIAGLKRCLCGYCSRLRIPGNCASIANSQRAPHSKSSCFQSFRIFRRLKNPRPRSLKIAPARRCITAGSPSEMVLADDSGLVVPALGGAPGVHSARYAGPNATSADRVRKLLDEMAGKTGDERRARFVCVICDRTAGPRARGCLRLRGRHHR